MPLPTPYYETRLGKLYHADSIELMKLLPDTSVDLVLTDPPYGHNNNDGDLIHNREAALGLRPQMEEDARPIDNDDRESADRLYRALLTESLRLLTPSGGCCCCCGGGGPDPQFARWSNWMDETLRFKMMVVWDKGGLGMGWHYRRNYETVLVGTKTERCNWYGGNTVGNVIRDVPKILPQKWQHPTEKPEALMAKFIGWHTRPGDMVLDPFVGSGPTVVAAERMGRRWIGVDVETRWLDMAVAKLQRLEGMGTETY